MEAHAASLQEVKEEEGERPMKKGKFDCCEKHSRPYVYWVRGVEEFHCIECAAENSPIKLELIEDVLPQIKESIALDVPNAKKKVEEFLHSLNVMHAELVNKQNKFDEFMKFVQTINDRFIREIKDLVCVRSRALETASELSNVDNQIKSIQTTADIHVAVACKSTLKKVAAHSSVPTSDLPQSLLFTIARSYVEEAIGENSPSKAAFVDAVQKPSPETVRAAVQLKGGVGWKVNHNNSEAALLALADRQPSILGLVAGENTSEPLPVAALARAAKGCAVQAIFVDTFCTATDTAKDGERLQHLTANKSLRLETFIGHLDRQNFSTLPTSITQLGLAIGRAANAAAVSSLRPWKGLNYLHVSVSSRVAAEDLKPLPSVDYKRLYFPFLSDAGVDSVRPAIEALVPDLRLNILYFPKSQLTAAGARRLTQRLQGVKVGSVFIEASGTWQPGAEEKKSLEAELRSATGCGVVGWAIYWS